MASYTAQAIIKEQNYTSYTAMYEVGDIVAIYDRITDKPTSKGNLCFVHVTGVPENINLKNLGSELSRPEFIGGTSEQEISKKRAWSVNILGLDEYSNLLQTKEIIISWPVALAVFTRKIDGVSGGEYYKGLGI